MEHIFVALRSLGPELFQLGPFSLRWYGLLIAISVLVGLNLSSELASKKGLKKMAIATPAFVSDCLETLEEIGMEAAEDFEEKGGEKLYVIPCINDRPDWVNVLSRWIDQWALAETAKTS